MLPSKPVPSKDDLEEASTERGGDSGKMSRQWEGREKKHLDESINELKRVDGRNGIRWLRVSPRRWRSWGQVYFTPKEQITRTKQDWRSERLEK